MKKQTTYMLKAGEIARKWHLVDVKGQVLGKVATVIAQKLIGKHKTTYTPHMDDGDFVVVINAREVAVTGDKELTKVYNTHSGFPGGLKQKTLGDLVATFPERVIEKAVYNMLPKNKLQKRRIKLLEITD